MDHGSWGARWVGRSGGPLESERRPGGGFVLARGGLGHRPILRPFCHGAPMPGSYRHAEINGSAAAARTADFGRPLLGPNRFDHDTFPFRVQNLGLSLWSVRDCVNHNTTFPRSELPIVPGR